ncbi:hypothetical protein [Shewanella sp. ALD9]|jgi:hypothetical protein|nr:hypothetical protein [Shewanella sp. ALD9]
MTNIGQLELSAHRGDILKEVNRLIENIVLFFRWNVSEIDKRWAEKCL